MAEATALEAAIACVQRKLPGDLFPLPLSPFEKFVIWDETEQHPMTTFVELHFRSSLDRKLLTDALNLAVHAHPLLACTIVERHGNLEWQYDPKFKQTILGDSEYPSSMRPLRIDLRKETGLRVWLQSKGGTAKLVFQFHHACCDGVGFRRLLVDCLTYYAGHSIDPKSPFKASRDRLQPELLAKRFDFSETCDVPAKVTLSGWQRLRNAYYFHFQPPAPLAATRQMPKEEPGAIQPFQPLKHRIMDRETSEKILAKTRSTNVGVNDLALALLFWTCRIWNEKHNLQTHGNRIRLLMAYDLRSRMDLRMPATNRLSFAFLGRTYAQSKDLHELIASVKAEVRYIKDSRLPLDFVNALEAGCKTPRLMRWLLARSSNMATAALTYTGDLSRGLRKFFPEADGALKVGDTQLVNVMGAPPVRRNTNVSLGLCINWGQLCLSAAWNREAIQEHECEEFLELYHQAWERWLNDR